jgi:hypothetical protein
MTSQIGPQCGECRRGITGVIAQAAGLAMGHYARRRSGPFSGKERSGADRARSVARIGRHIRYKRHKACRGNHLRVADRG